MGMDSCGTPATLAWHRFEFPVSNGVTNDNMNGANFGVLSNPLYFRGMSISMGASLYCSLAMREKTALTVISSNLIDLFSTTSMNAGFPTILAI